MSRNKKITVPWTDMVNSTAWYTAYKEVVDGELKRYIFVPHEENGIGMTTAVMSSRQVGAMHVTLGEWKGYHIVIKVGKEAGQEVDYPCMEVIPVR